MARRRFRSSNQRHEPGTERALYETVFSPPALAATSRIELMRLVRGGEDTYLELKVKLSNPERIAQEIVALANTGGGLIVFGVNDQMRVEGLDDPEEVREQLAYICREQIVPSIVPYIDSVAFDNGRRIVALDIVPKRRPYRTRYEGRYYIRFAAEKREATREELSVLLDEARPLFYENTPALGAQMADIDDAQLWSFVREFDESIFNETKGYPTEEILERDLLLATSSGSESVPTAAGLLLFGKNQRVAELLPRSAITAIRFAGDTAQSPVIERVQLVGNLFTLYEATLKFVNRYADLWDKRPRQFPGSLTTDAPVRARANYHADAVREAIANAIVHRDLAMRDLTTRLYIYDGSIEILNPRRGAGFMPVAQRAIRYGVPQRLNPQISAIFSSIAYGLDTPRGGLPMLLREARLFSSRRVELNTSSDEFRLRLHGI